MATSGGSSSALHAQNSSNAAGAQGSAGNPRKFAEKIQILNIKGAEETAEFEKIMSECAAVRVGQQSYHTDNVTSQAIDGQKNHSMNMKNPNFAAQMSGQVRATSPGNSGFPNLYAGGSGVIVSSTGTRHLSPVPFNSVVNRHGSMPNMAPLPGGNGVGNLTNKSPVGDLPAMLKQYNVTNTASIKREPQVSHQQGNLETIARISEIISMSPVPSMSTSSCTTLVDSSQPSRKLPVNQTPQQYQHNRTRLNTTPCASNPSPNCSRSGIPGSSNSPGPIRNRQRRHETSPFERKSIVPEYAGIENNRRESGGSTGSNISAQHLSPPDLSVRRFYSDPSLHQTVNGVQQVSSQYQPNPVSDTSGSQTIVPTQVNQEQVNPNIGFGNTLGGVSPLENASPTIARRAVGDPNQDPNQIPVVGQVTNAYVQMVNRGNNSKASSPDYRVTTDKPLPIAGQTISYLPLPGGISEGPHGSGDNLTVGQNSGAFIPGGGGKPSGSLPDLTNFHVNSQSPSPCSGPNVASGESSNGQAMPFCQSLSTAAVCSPNYSPGTPRNATVNNNGNAKLTLGKFLNNKDAHRQQVQYATNPTSTENANIMTQQNNSSASGHSTVDNSSPTLTYQHPSTAKSVVRLSDNEISEILSLPIALVQGENSYSGDPTMTSGSTSSNVATSSATSDSSIISPNNEGNQMPNGRNGTGANDVFMNKNNQNNNNNSNNIKTEPICDNSLEFLNPLQNVINMNKGVDMDQSDGGMMNEDNQTMFFGATNNADFVGGPNNAEQSYSNKGDGGLTNYRNPQPIPAAHSPSSHIHGGSSPFGARSTSPIDISSLTGSPHHSPNPRYNALPSIGSLESSGSIPGGGTNGYSAGTYGSASSPGYSSDMMISAGGVPPGSVGSATQMDLGLSKEFQRFTVTEPGSQQQVGMYFPSSPAQTQHGQHMPQQHNSLNYHSSPNQPLHDWMNGGNQNHLGVDSGGTGGIDIGNNQQNNASMPSPNPQTPSSIPDILISRCGDDSGSDQTLQRLIAMGEFDNDSMFSEELRADLGKLDDNMIRLLEDNVQMDQNIADAVTEEHLKL